MGYRILDLSGRPSRLTETIGVTKGKSMAFNRAMSAKLGITPSSKIVAAVTDGGFLALRIEGKDAPLGRALHKNGNTYSFSCVKLMRNIPSGRYRVTGRDGDFWITDIKYEEK